MDKNNIIGFVLIAAVLIGYGIWTQPSAEEQAAARHQDSIENVARQKAENAAKLAAQQKAIQPLPKLTQQHSSIRLLTEPHRMWCSKTRM